MHSEQFVPAVLGFVIGMMAYAFVSEIVWPSVQNWLERRMRNRGE